MIDRPFISRVLFTLSAVIIAGCAATTAEPTEVRLANPAAVYCAEQGYLHEIRTEAGGGQYGVCIFPGGSECEEWAFYRGECGPGGAVAEQATEVPTDVPTEPATAQPTSSQTGVGVSVGVILGVGVAVGVVVGVGVGVDVGVHTICNARLCDTPAAIAT